MTTTTTTTSGDRTFIDLDVTLIDPDPGNETRPVDRDFINSIRTHGVIEPILVVPHPDTKGRYLLVAGERRLTGATKAKLATIGAIIRTDLDQTARIELQTVENMQRSDLTPCQQARQLMRLTAVGHNVAKLAKAVGRSQNFVRERLRLAELPADAQTLVDAGEWTIEAGIAALALVDLPDALAELIERKPRNVAHAVEQTLTKITFETEATALVQKAHDNGITVLQLDDKYETLTSLAIEDKDHNGEPCHAVILQGGGLRGKARLVGVCTKIANHRKTGSSKIKTPTRPGLSDAERKTRADKKEADTARLDAMTAIASGRLTKTAAHELIIEALLGSAGAEPTKRACAILNIEPDETGGWKDHNGALRTYASATAANQLRAATVVAMIHHDNSYKSGWGTAGQRWATWLKARGWTPTAHDRKLIKDFAKK